MNTLDPLGERYRDLREAWRAVRSQRLARKNELVAAGGTIAAVREDRRYRSLKKEQRRITVELRHVEKKIQRKKALRNTAEQSPE